MHRTWKQTFSVLTGLLLTVGIVMAMAQTPAKPKPKPKRLNQVIELLSEGQPVYYTGSHSGTTGTFAQGAKDAQTYADYISYDMEHAPFDVAGLKSYMEGLASAGPDRSGHHIPTVIVNVPVNGLDYAAVHANAWMFNQVLATGVMGIMLTHADDPGAIRAFVEAVRFPVHHQGVGVDGLPEGRRGVHGVATAAKIWGVSQQEYVDKADPWPLNPNGELFLGVKEEDKYALANVDQNLKVPGIGMAEWGPGDMALSLGVPMGANSTKDPRMVAARAKVLAACKANHIFFLNSLTPQDIIAQLKEGVMVGPASPEAVAIGRKYTKRPLPY